MDNNNFQREVLLSQILKEVKEVSKEVKEVSNEVKEVRSLVGEILEGQVEMEKNILNRLTTLEERNNRK